MPHRGLARPPRHCSWHSFWSSPIASGTRARCLDLRCDLSSVRLASSRLASPRTSRASRRVRVRVRVTSRIPSRSRSRVCSIRDYVFSQVRHARCTCESRSIPRGKRSRRDFSSVREKKNAADDLLQMLFPENGNNLQRSMRHRISCDFSDPDLHSECRMENDNHRHPRQNGRKDHLRDQSLYDHFNFYAAHNRRFKEKYIYDATMGGSGHYVGCRSSCERPLHRDYVLRKHRSY